MGKIKMPKQLFAFNSNGSKIKVEDVINPEKFKSISIDSGMAINKPSNGEGFWTSTFVGKDELYSDWVRWAYYENFREYDKGILITPKDNLDVYVIENLSDFDRLPKLFNFGEPSISEKYINFYELVKHGYCGLWCKEMTMELHATVLDKLSSFDCRLNAWDCESTVWFNLDWIKDIEVIDINY